MIDRTSTSDFDQRKDFIAHGGVGIGLGGMRADLARYCQRR